MSDTKLSKYLINKDSSPQVILKKPTKNIEMRQSFMVSYLRPPTPPQPGEIIIEKEPNTVNLLILFKRLNQFLYLISLYSQCQLHRHL